MAIRIALAHKLLVRLNAKARDARARYANATYSQIVAHPNPLPQKRAFAAAPVFLRAHPTKRINLMKAAVLHEVNKPLVIEDVSLQKPGPREVLIRTSVAGLCQFRPAFHGRALSGIRCPRCSAANPPASSKRSDRM